MKKTITIFFAVFAISISLSAEKNINAEELIWQEITQGSYQNLKRFYIFFTYKLFEEKNIPVLLGNQNSKTPKIVSAEKVFLNFVKQMKFRDNSALLARNYRNAVKQKNPDGKTNLDKWGSSLYTWSMTPEKWKLAKEFQLYRQNPVGKESLRTFPVLWDKRPDLLKGMISVLSMGGYVSILKDEEFKICLAYAKEWLELGDESIPEILKLLETGDDCEKNLAIRMLGIKKAKEAVPIILEKMEENSLRNASFEALTKIKDKKAIPRLIKAFYNPDFDQGAIVKTMCAIGGKQVEKELKDWLNDPDLSKGRKRSIMYGIWRAKYKPGIKLLTPFLQSKDKKLKEAAEDALKKLQGK